MATHFEMGHYFKSKQNIKVQKLKILRGTPKNIKHMNCGYERF